MFLFVVPLVLVGFWVGSLFFVLLGLVSPNEALGRPSRVVSKAFPSLDHEELDPYPPKQSLSGHKEDEWSLVLTSPHESQASWWVLGDGHAGLSFPSELPVGMIQRLHHSPPLFLKRDCCSSFWSTPESEGLCCWAPGEGFL